MPCIVGRDGIRKILPIPLSEKELSQLNDSAKMLKDIIKNSNLDI
jgi:malate/lactate dehydrogenase